MGQTMVPMKGMKPTPQDDWATCWHAGYRMMFQWNQKPESSIDYLLSAEIGADALAECKVKGILRKYWGSACDAFGMYGHSGRNATEFSYITNLLDNNGPVLFHWAKDEGIHTVVLIGYNDDQETITYIDPWWDVEPKIATTRPAGFSWINIGIKKSDTWAGVLQHW